MATRTAMASNCAEIRVAILDDCAVVWRGCGVRFSCKPDASVRARLRRSHDLCTWIKANSTRSSSSEFSGDNIDHIPDNRNGQVQLTRNLFPHLGQQEFLRCRLNDSRVANFTAKFPRNSKAAIKQKREASCKFGIYGHAEFPVARTRLEAL